MTIKAVVFDMDGVLIDARDWHFQALNEALGLFGFRIDEKLHENQFDGLPTKVKLEMLSTDFGLPWSLHPIIQEVKQNRTLRIAAEKCFPSTQHLLLLGRLKHEGMKIGVATNSIRQTAEYMLEYAGVSKYLDCLVTNEEVSHPKPNPEIYRMICSLLKVETQETLVFEDNENGVRAATLAGCRVIEVGSPSEVDLGRYFSQNSRIAND
jgi:HAD superfamily hydrolase (TIGR01509 family)